LGAVPFLRQAKHGLDHLRARASRAFPRENQGCSDNLSMRQTIPLTCKTPPRFGALKFMDFTYLMH
jgi:hypothetical protein